MIEPKSVLLKAYMDTNVFIIGLSKTETNSRLIIEAAKLGQFISVISFHVIDEVENWFRKEDREKVFEVSILLKSIASEIVTIEKIKEVMNEYKGVVPLDDLPHFCAAKIANVDILISTNRHFLKEQKEIIAKTPKEFVRDILKLKKFYSTAE